METILLSVLLVGGVMGAMAVGVIFRRAPLKGSCGGPGAADCLCEQTGRKDACKTPSTERRGPDGVVFHEP